MFKTIVLIIILMLIAACAKTPETSTAVGKEFIVEKLFTYEGCTVYRFVDAGYNRYYTNCNGETISQYSCGKSCRRDDNISTKIE